MAALSPAEALAAGNAVSPALTIAFGVAEDARVTWSFCWSTSRARPRGEPALPAMAYAVLRDSSESVTAVPAMWACCLITSSRSVALTRAVRTPLDAFVN